jgi:peptide/nickel transport system substrate-binding protein
MPQNGISDADLSGPKIGRRTALKLFGALGIPAGLAGCLGEDDGTDANEGNSDGGDSGGNDADDGTPDSGKTGGKIVGAWTQGELPNLDPVLSDFFHQQEIIMNVFDSLVQVTPTLEIVPGIATDWTVEDDGTTYTFDLREGVQFQEGYGELTATDVKFTLERGLTADGTQRAGNLFAIAEDGITAIDDYTIEITLEEPYSPFIAMVSHAGLGCLIQPKAALDDLGRSGFRDRFRSQPIGSGPFQITENVPGESITLQAFDDYWQTDDDSESLPYLDEVEIRPLAEASTVINGLKSGEIDFVNHPPEENLDELRDTQAIEVLRSPAGGWVGTRWNVKREPFSSTKARQAIAKLLDQKEFVQRAFFGNVEPAKGPIPPLHGDFYRSNKPDYQDYNQSEGERLLEESGMEGSSIEIIIPEGNERQARVFKDMLGDYFDIEINATTTSVYSDRTRDYDFDMTISGSSPDPDIDSLRFFFLPRDQDGQYNFTGYSNPEASELLRAQAREPDREKRAELLQDAEDILMEDAARAWIHHHTSWVVLASHLNGYQPRVIQRDLSTVWLDE